MYLESSQDESIYTQKSENVASQNFVFAFSPREPLVKYLPAHYWEEGAVSAKALHLGVCLISLRNIKAARVAKQNERVDDRR